VKPVGRRKMSIGVTIEDVDAVEGWKSIGWSKGFRLIERILGGRTVGASVVSQ